MGKIWWKAAEYAKNDFRKEIEKRMIDCGYKSKKELAEDMGMPPRTLYRWFEQDIGDMRVSTLMGLVKALSPDPVIFLKLVGYTSKDIKRAIEKLSEVSA